VRKNVSNYVERKCSTSFMLQKVVILFLPSTCLLVFTSSNLFFSFQCKIRVIALEQYYPIFCSLIRALQLKLLESLIKKVKSSSSDGRSIACTAACTTFHTEIE